MNKGESERSVDITLSGNICPAFGGKPIREIVCGEVKESLLHAYGYESIAGSSGSTKSLILLIKTYRH